MSFRLSDSLSPKAKDEFWALFIGEVIEKRGLAFGGNEEGFITKFGRGSATEEDREAVSRWLTERPGIDRVTIAQLEDAWYGRAESAA